MRLPTTDSKKPFNVLIDTGNLDSEEFELQMDLQEDNNPERELPEFTLDTQLEDKRLESWVELLLQVALVYKHFKFFIVSRLSTLCVSDAMQTYML